MNNEQLPAPSVAEGSVAEGRGTMHCSYFRGAKIEINAEFKKHYFCLEMIKFMLPV